jgi:colicin import membrane protein
MVQAGGHRVLAGLLVAVLLGLGGCSSGRASTKVDEAWLARVPPAEMEPVHKARITQNKAVDETTRARVSLEDAKSALEVAKNNEKAAKARREAEEGALQAAREKGQANDITRVEQGLRDADLEHRAALAEVEFREQVVATREAMEQMRARELAVADAELAQTEYQALLRSGDVRAQELDGKAFADKLAKARSEARETQDAVDALLQAQRQSQARWQQLDSQVKAYGGSGR